MKKSLLVLLGISLTLGALAQSRVPSTEKPAKIKRDWNKLDLSNRSADHLVIQYGGDSWTNRPDSVRTTGFSRHFNIYFMLDKPFKTNPRFSLAFGGGIGSSNMFFKNTNVGLKATTPRLPFTNVDSANHFKKYKLTSIYLEVPVELRFYADPEHTNKSWKGAIGLKVGTLLKSFTKGKDLQNKNNATLHGSKYIVKESNKNFLNGTMLAATARVGYGIFSIGAGYQFTSVLRDGAGAGMNRVSIGVTISGL